MSFSDWNLVCPLNTAVLRAIAYFAYVKQKMGIRSEEMSKSILTYLVPKPFDQIKPLTDSKEASPSISDPRLRGAPSTDTYQC
jgi:hypothetical protein